MTQRGSAHKTADLERAISLFFAVRGIVRTRLAQGKKLDPSAWLRIEFLKFVRDRKNPKMKEVAEYLSITAPSATSLVRRFEKEGLIEIRHDLVDRRSSRLVLTREGRATLRRSIACGQKLLKELFSGLSESELRVFVQALKRIEEKGHA